MGENKKARTFQLRLETIQRLDVQAQAHELWGSNLVDLLLQRGLAEMEAGRWILKRRPVKYKAEWG